MRGKATKGNKGTVTATSPGGIQRYMSTEASMLEEPQGSPRLGVSSRPGINKQRGASEENKSKSARVRISGSQQMYGSETQEGPYGRTEEEDTARGNKPPLQLTQEEAPYIREMLAELLLKLETSLKKEIATVRVDIGHVLKRVEEMEDRLEEHERRLEGMNMQIRDIQRANRSLLYKLEDQENRSRRKNLRIKGLPEKFGKEELAPALQQLLNPLLDREIMAPLKVDRAHRVARYPRNTSESPRDVIVKFHYEEEKVKILGKLRHQSGLSIEGAEIQVYSDLSAETLTRRRLLKPLTALLKTTEIAYQWGFLACLIGKRNGRTAVLRFPEDLEDFCRKLDIATPRIPGWGVEETAAPARDIIGRREGRSTMVNIS